MIETIKFPPQMLPASKKNKEWRQKHPDWASNVKYLNNSAIRKSLMNKMINFDLYAGKVHMRDIKAFTNPYDIKASYVTDKVQHYPILNNALDLITGEECNKKGEIVAKLANPDAISEMEEAKTKVAKQKILEYIQSELTPEQETQEASNIIKYLNYSYQDLREVNANFILQDVMKNVDFYRKLQEGKKHVLICNEEIYWFGIVGGETVMELLNPKKVYTFRTSQSSRIEDSDIIILDDHWSPARVLDTFYDKLTKEDHKKLEDYINNGVSGEDDRFVDDRQGYYYLPEAMEGDTLDMFIHAGEELGLPIDDYTDADGNLRVVRIYWKSKRKILKLKRYDPETGEVIEEPVGENYIPRKELGEEVTPYWISEWWGGTKVSKDIYLDIKPLDLQFRSPYNPSICFPPIVGQVYATNQQSSMSFVDKMKPLSYLYDAIMDRLIRMVAINVGNVTEVDLAKIAFDDPDKFLHFIRTDAIAYVNSTKETNKGQAVGHFNAVGGRNLNMDQSSAISTYSNLLEYIKSSMLEMVGVTPQRLGQISNRETVGGVERAVAQSNHITGELDAVHNNVIKRCAEKLLETEKFALKGNKKKVQYSYNGVTGILEIDGDDFSERYYSIYMENDLDLAGLRQKIEGLAQAWSQNETIKPSTLLSIYEDKSIASIRQKLRNDEDEKVNRDQEQFAQTQEIQRQQMAITEAQVKFEQDMKVQELQLEDLISQRQEATKLQIKMLDLQVNNGEDNTLEIEKLQIQKDKLDADIKVKSQQLELEKQRIQESVRHNKETESIGRIKKVTTSKK